MADAEIIQLGQHRQPRPGASSGRTGRRRSAEPVTAEPVPGQEKDEPSVASATGSPLVEVSASQADRTDGSGGRPVDEEHGRPSVPDAEPDPTTDASPDPATAPTPQPSSEPGESGNPFGWDWHQAAADVLDFARSRVRGDYPVDEFGFDPEFTTRVFLPMLRPLVQSWFRVEVRGIENVPESGPALLVSNHAGTMPLDGMVLQAVVYDEIARHVRMLGADLVFKTPYSHDLARRTGTTLASQEDAERLLAADHLVSVFPEGFKGLGKPYADRYKLQRFGRGGFVSAAVRASVPLIPVSIVGSEEIYPLISRARPLARALGLPYFPVTPLFPWLGVLGMVPLPSKWIIEFGEAIATDELPPGAADDPMVVFHITDQVRETIQQTLYALLMQRRSTFF